MWLCSLECSNVPPDGCWCALQLVLKSAGKYKSPPSQGRKSSVYRRISIKSESFFSRHSRLIFTANAEKILRVSFASNQEKKQKFGKELDPHGGRHYARFCVTCDWSVSADCHRTKRMEGKRRSLTIFSKIIKRMAILFHVHLFLCRDATEPLQLHSLP